MSGKIRRYNARRDRKAIRRVWQECGWISEEKRELDALDRFISVGDAWVYDLDGQAECLVHSVPGQFLHTGSSLDLSAITAVTTSRVARNLGAASGLLAHVIADQAVRGVHLTGLGVFEQGFYNRLGYGNGTYEHWVSFDPAWLTDLGKPRVPGRLTADDWKVIHAARLTRYKLHGAVDLNPPEMTQADMMFGKNSFGLGYREGGELTHFFCAHADNVGDGPYTIDWMAYRNLDQLRELLGLLRGLGDQVRVVRMHEPKHIQLQSLLRKPFQLYHITENSKNPSRAAAYAYWQLRILDLSACIEVLSVPGSLEFNLNLTDPVQALLPDEAKWQGIAGEYAVSLGSSSSAEPGTKGGLPTLEATVNDFSRFWMGSARADALAAFGSFRAEPDLLDALDQSILIPQPDPMWDY